MTNKRVFELLYNGGTTAVFHSTKHGIEIPLNIHQVMTDQVSARGIYNDYFAKIYKFHVKRTETSSKQEIKVSYVLENKVIAAIDKVLTWFIKQYFDSLDSNLFKIFNKLKILKIPSGYVNPAHKLYDIYHNDQYYFEDLKRYTLALRCFNFHTKNNTWTSYYQQMPNKMKYLAPVRIPAYYFQIFTNGQQLNQIPRNHNLELNSWLEYLSRLHFLSERRNVNIWLNATHEELKTGIRIISPEIDFRKTRKVIDVIDIIKDYPDPFNGNFINLARRAQEWHRDFTRTNYLKYTRGLTEETKVAVPFIPLPENKHIKFLSTVGELFEESNKMQHCVASYAQDAVDGRCYLFHCSYMNTEATTEVRPNGRINQSRGPHNQENQASRYAERVLSQWAKLLETTNIPLTIQPQLQELAF